jgi:DNA-binding transcriptional LysR family regulator
VLDAVDDALAVGHRQEPRGRLLLGLPVAGGRDLWFGLARAYSERYPAVEVETREAMTEPLQRQVQDGELDGAIGLVATRQPGLRYTALYEQTVSVWMHETHELASRSELTLADLDGRRVTLAGGSLGVMSNYNGVMRRLFAEAGAEPEFVTNREIFPGRAGHEPDFLTVSVVLDYPREVVRVPLVPELTLPFVFVERNDVNRSAVRAFAPFAREYLAG